MAAVSRGERGYGLAHVDLSTGQFRVTEIENRVDLLNELTRIGPAEVLVPEGSDLLESPGHRPIAWRSAEKKPSMRGGRRRS